MGFKNLKLFLLIVLSSIFLFLLQEKILSNNISTIIKNSIKENKKSPYNKIDRLTKYKNNLEKKIEKFVVDNDKFLKEDNVNLKFTYEGKKNLSGSEIEVNIYSPQGRYIAHGIHEIFPGSAYLDFYENKIFLVSASGIIASANEDNYSLKFKQIKNNLDSFINEKQYSKGTWFSIKDILINENRIFISYTREVTPNCWNTSMVSAEINEKFLFFKKLFAPVTCIDKLNNPEGIFNAHQSGGRIFNFDKDNLLFSTGEFRNRYLAQDDKSFFGKILLINKNTGDYKVFSKGHRNVQGIYFNKEEDFVLSTEHGPMGGDEINLIRINSVNKNFGWPISSYGKHYPSSIRADKNVYRKYPLKKSHNKYGFVEPLKYFVPSIGISEIIQIDNNAYLLSSLKDKSIYSFSLKGNQILNFKRYFVGERIRDVIKKQKKVYLFLEDSSSIGIINL